MMGTYKSEIKFELEFGTNGMMVSKWFSNDNLFFETSDLSKPTSSIIVNSEFPAKIKILLSGKTDGDTVVEDGKIVADKFIHITNISLNRIPIFYRNLNNLNVNYLTEDGRILNQRFFSWNGEVEIFFDEPDPLLWHLKYNNRY